MEGGTEKSSNDLVKITEGSATILFPNSNEVFYNPVQELNRDLSVAVIKSFAKHLWTPTSKKKVRPKQGLSSPVVQADEGEKNCKEEEHAGSDTAADNGGESEHKEGREGGRHRDEAAVMEGCGGMELEELGGGGGKEEGGETSSEEVVREVTEEDRGEEKEESGTEVVEMAVARSTDNSYKPIKQTGLRVLEALAASGLRSIRYALEVPGVESVVANDISVKAFQSMQRNIQYNQVMGKVFPSQRDASMLMYEHREPYRRFDVIDLDPYGSPSIFLDATVQSVKDGGLLCVTCTDMSVLCGVRSETCHSKYGATSLKAKYCHEMALRIALASLESHANRYQRYIIPLLSCSVDFYIRIFIRIFTGAQEVKKSPSKIANVYHCIGCETFHLQPIGKTIEQGESKKYLPANGPPVGRRCDQCNSIFRLGGPMWAAPIHDLDFVQTLLKEVEDSPAGTYNTKDRIKGLLTVISEELVSVPLYYELDSVCSTLHCETPKMLALRSALLDQGFQVSLSHANAKAVKTSAPHDVFWNVMRCWAGRHEKKELSPTSPGFIILSKTAQIEANFEIRKDANPPSRLLKLSRFPENPESNWGPKARAKRKKAFVEAGSSSKKPKRSQQQEEKTKN